MSILSRDFHYVQDVSFPCMFTRYFKEILYKIVHKINKFEITLIIKTIVRLFFAKFFIKNSSEFSRSISNTLRAFLVPHGYSCLLHGTCRRSTISKKPSPHLEQIVSLIGRSRSVISCCRIPGRMLLQHDRCMVFLLPFHILPS